MRKEIYLCDICKSEIPFDTGIQLILRVPAEFTIVKELSHIKNQPVLSDLCITCYFSQFSKLLGLQVIK